MNTPPLIKISHLKKYFPVKNGPFRKPLLSKAVDDISIEIPAGTTLGLVGESGSGKSTLGRCLIRLIEPTEGSVFINGEEITRLSSKKLLPFRKIVQMIFQDPYGALNPRMTVDRTLREILHVHRIAEGTAATTEIAKLLDMVGLPETARHKYPHEFSGGQRQRITIARALSVRPKFIVCDEPVSALDVSVQAQIINLLDDLQKELGLTYLFIGHDLSVVRHISDRIAVMYLGQIVESAERDALFNEPRHPYTRALLASAPVADPSKRPIRTLLSGEIPSPIYRPYGCAFHTRCPIAEARCKEIIPELREISPGHEAACHLA